VFAASTASAQTSGCTWIATPTPHALCHTNNGTYGDGNACDNGLLCGEGCCSWEFEIKNEWEGCVVTRVDICAALDCDTDPGPISPCQRNANSPNHICDLCPVKYPWTGVWSEDPACPRLYPPGGTLADSTCDSVCRTSCVHMVETSGGLPYKSSVKIPVGFTGCDPSGSKCIDVCVTLDCAGQTSQVCCRVVLPACTSDPAGPYGPKPCIESGAAPSGQDIGLDAAEKSLQPVSSAQTRPDGK